MPDATKILDKITRYSVRALVFLIPLFFLSLGSQALDFQKQALLVLLTMIALGAFVLKTLVGREVEIKRTLLSSIVLIFILVLAASTIFSWDSAQSFFGPVGVASSGFLTWLCLAAFFFLTVNSFNSAEEVENLVWIGLSSTLIAGLFGFLQAWGKFILPWEFTRVRNFTTVGGFNSLGLFMAAMLPLVITLHLAKKKSFHKIGLIVLGTLSFLILIIANFWATWICLGVGMIGLIVLLKINPGRVNSNWIILPVVLLVIAFSFVLIQPKLPGLPDPSAEISLSYNSAFQMGRKIISSDQGNIMAVLGTGPGTFTLLYDLFKPKEISESIWWTISFQRAPSQMLELLGTTGILGVLAMLGVILSFGTISIRNLIRQQRGKFTLDKALKTGLISGWLVLAAGKFLYPAALSIEFLFWLFMGLFIIIILSKE